MTTLRERLAIAAATPHIDETGQLKLAQAADGTATSVEINHVDIFGWCAVAWRRGLKVRVRLEVVPSPPAPPAPAPERCA